MNTNSNAIWENASNLVDFELSRPLLFLDDMREAFFRWFGIEKSSHVVDGGCGPGVLTRFIARGLTDGFVTGFDISPHFVEYGNGKIREEGLESRAQIVREDGFSLSFPDNTFDAAVGHTYLGVLSDKERGLRELIRVVKSGGTVAASVSMGDAPAVSWPGERPYLGQARLEALLERYRAAYRTVFTPTELRQDEVWSAMRYPRLFQVCGLQEVSLHPYASGYSLCDGRWPEAFKLRQIASDMDREMEIYQKNRTEPRFSEHGFTNEDFDELIELSRGKREHMLFEMREGTNWSWRARLHFVVAGRKAVQ